LLRIQCSEDAIANQGAVHPQSDRHCQRPSSEERRLVGELLVHGALTSERDNPLQKDTDDES